VSYARINELRPKPKWSPPGQTPGEARCSYCGRRGPVNRPCEGCGAVQDFAPLATRSSGDEPPPNCHPNAEIRRDALRLAQAIGVALGSVLAAMLASYFANQ
jgi:hypothetical protein